MLTRIRERASGWVAWVIVILLAIPFALWGIQSYFEGGSEPPVATVNGEEIPLYTYINELSRQRQELAERGEDISELEDLLRVEVVNSMIQRRLITQYVSARNYRLPDHLLRQRIAAIPQFARDGKFDPELYRGLLRANGYTTQVFEEIERESAAVDQLALGISQSAFVSAAELNRLIALQRQTRTAEYAVIEVGSAAEKIEITDADAKQFYDDNLDIFHTTEKVKVDYIELNIDKIAASIELTDTEINEVYAQYRSRYAQSETRKASHILFAIDEDDAAALSVANTVLDELNTGGDFAALAKQHSADPGSKDNGGDLGTIARGQMVAPFEEAVFAMTEGEIRGPIKTQFGYHIIKLTELIGARQQPLEEVRAEVIADARRARAENRFAELGESFENLVFENPDSLAVATDELGLEIQQTDWFTAESGSGLAAETAVRRAAFSEEVLVDGLNSVAIKLGFDRLVALHIAEHQPAQALTFDAVRAEIIAQLQIQQARTDIAELGEQLSNELTAGETTWAEVKSNHQLNSELITAGRTDIPDELTELGDAVFAMQPPPDGQYSYGGVALTNGDYALFELREVGAVDAITAEDRETLRRQLLARDGYGLYQQLHTTIRRRADIFIDEDALRDPEGARYEAQQAANYGRSTY